MIKDSKGKVVKVSVGGKYKDDIQIVAATYQNGAEVPEKEQNFIYKKYPMELERLWVEKRVCESSGYAELDR